jgi:WD40 repeat protein
MERGPGRVVRQFIDRRYADASGFAFAPDESRVAVAFGHRVGIWDLDDPDRPPAMIAAHEGMVRAVGFTPSGRSLLTAGMDGLVRFWEPTTGAEQRSFNWNVGQVQAAAISPDGLLCAAGSSDGHLVVWDVDA